MIFSLVLPAIDTHKAYILYRLLKGQRIKNKEMWACIDTSYSASRISELRGDGWEISDTYLSEISKQKKSVRVKQYFMKHTVLSELYRYKEVQEFIDNYERWNIKKAG